MANSLKIGDKAPDFSLPDTEFKNRTEKCGSRFF